MVTIIAVQKNSVIVAYSQKFYELFRHNGTSWQTTSTAVNPKFPEGVSKMASFQQTPMQVSCTLKNCAFNRTQEEQLELVLQGPGQSKQESGNTNNSGNHGVINYNFYNQQWQNSVDLEHALEQNNTAYGGTGGGDSAHNVNRTESSNLLLSGLQTAATILPLLADSTTEEFENSDRVSKTQAGASTLVTQHHVGCLTYPKKERTAPSSAADEPTKAGPSVGRFITIPVGEWTSTNAVYSGWFLPLPYVALTRNTPFAAMARRHFLLNCGWHVQVQVNSTRFHGGALGVFMVPQFVVDNHKNLQAGTFTGQADVSLFNLQQMFLYPHQIINPRTNSSAEIKVPYTNATPSQDPTQCAPWTLVIMVISQLSYSAGATTSLEIVASIKPEDAEFHGIRQTNSLFQGLPKNRNDSSAYAFASTQPHYAQPDYGAVTRSSPRFNPAEITDLLQISMIPTLTHTRAASFQQVIPTSALVTINVALSATDLLNTSLETVSRGFAQYRGSIMIRMMFVGNQMQNVRFVASYTPPGADPPATLEEAMDGIYTIYDTGLNSTADFVIPYISPTDYRYANSTGNYDTGVAGYFTIWQLTNLAVPPGSPATAELLVFASSGADFEWRLPTTPYLVLQGEDSQLTPAEAGATPEATADNSNQETVPIPYTQHRLSQSAVRFWFDRFFKCHTLDINVKNAETATMVPLTWSYLTQNIPEVRWLTHATYLRFELEIALKTWNSTNLDMNMVYYAPGSLIPGGTTTWGSNTEPTSVRKTGACPVWSWNTITTPVFTTRIPFTSPAALIPQTWTGWGRWNHVDLNWGVSPGYDTLGTLAITQGAADSTDPRSFTLSVRFVDIQLFCPRPGFYITPPAPTHRGATNFSLLALAGDVELNPGPSLSKLMRKFDPDLDAIFKEFEEMKQTFDKITSSDYWMEIFSNTDKKKWLKRCIKFLAYGVILMKAKSDPLLAAATAFILTGDWLSNFCGKIVKWLKDSCKTPPPPLPTSDGDTFDGRGGDEAQSKAKEFVEKFAQPDWTQTGAKPKQKSSWFSKKLSVNSGDIKPKTEDVPLIDISKFGPTTDYPSCKNPFGPDMADMLQETEQLISEAQKTKANTNPFEMDEPEDLVGKFKRFFKMEGPVQELNQLLQLCRHAEWASQQIGKIIKWLGIWKKQEEDASEEAFKEKMAIYPEMMSKYEMYRCAPRHKEWQECKNYFDYMRKICMYHDPKLVNLFPNMVKQPHENQRQEPLLVVLRGPPGQGKSVAATMLAQMVAYSLTGKPDYYSYNSSTNFFDGYQQQPVVLIDDLGQNPSGEDFSVFCQMISTAPFIPNMADLKDKGQKFVSDVIIVTTNLADFKPTTIADPQALARRINFDYNVTAGQAYAKKNGCLDLERALEPTGCTAPHTFVTADIHLFSSACVNFRDRWARCDCSIIDVYDRIMAAHKSRGGLATKLAQIFKFEGPPKGRQHDVQKYCDENKVKPPNKKSVEKWCDLAIAQDPRDDAVLAFLRQNSDHSIFQAYVKRFYGGGPDPTKRPPWTWKKTLDLFQILLQVLAFISMLLSIGMTIWFLFSLQGAYSGNAQKREKPKGLKVVDIASMQGPPNFDLEKSLLERNCVQIACRRQDGSEFVTGGLAIRDRLIVMNNHLWEQSTHFQLDGAWMNKDQIPAIRPAIDGIPSELVFMNWAGTPGRQFRNITTHFPSGEAGHFVTGPQAKITGIVSHMHPNFMFTAESLGTAATSRTWDGVVPMVLKYKAQTAPGFCGSVVVVDNGVWKKVFGIHCAGAHGIGLAAIISQEMLAAIAQIPQFQGKIHSVKEHAYIYTPHKTQLYPTVAQDSETTVEPAALSPNDKRLEKPNEFKKSIMSKHIGDRTDGPQAMIRGARFYARLVRAKCGPVSERLSLREAVFGTENLDPMDMTRSPGWPYIGKSRRPDLVKEQDGEIWLDPVLRAELMNMMEGDFSHHKFVTFLKDELRDKEKVKAGKTRVIDIASFGHAIFGRVLFGRLAAAMHAKNGVELGSAVGTNPDIDWTRYAAEFKYSNFVDIDYSGFDATHSSFSFHCLKIFLKELGFDDIALKYVDSLCYSTHLWDDEQFQIDGGLPSGCSCTSIFNTILNNIAVRSLIPEVYDGEFQMLAYGDDLVLCSQERFDVDKYKEIVEEVTNYKITPASKCGTFEWTDLGGVVFLKRSFYKDGLLIRPVMTHKNLHNILSYARAGTVQEKILSVARLAQHRGKRDYDELFKPFEECGYFVPSFDDLELEFFSLFFG